VKRSGGESLKRPTVGGPRASGGGYYCEIVLEVVKMRNKSPVRVVLIYMQSR
jgi:hypothetical protein